MNAGTSPGNWMVMINCKRMRSIGGFVAFIGLLAFMLVGFLASCQNQPVVGSVETPIAGSTAPTLSEARTSAPPPSPSPSSLPKSTAAPPIVLAIPTEWQEAAATALATVGGSFSAHQWQLTVADSPSQALEAGAAQVALVAGQAGLVVHRRPLALAVAFTTPRANVSLSTAETILKNGDGDIKVMPWKDLPNGTRALRVAGLLPSEASYPLLEVWSLVAGAGHEQAARQIAPALEQTMAEDPVVHVSAVGDIMLDRVLGSRIRRGRLDFPFAAVADLLQSADLTVGNLESSLGTSGRPAQKSYTFRAPPQAALSLREAGFDVLSLANNHALDYGIQTLLEGIGLLGTQGISVVGAGEDHAAAHAPSMHVVDGIRLAFLAYVRVPSEGSNFSIKEWKAGTSEPGVALSDAASIAEDVTGAQSQADVVIVLLHSGHEFVQTPVNAQINAAHAAIDAGASLVIGHHAHVLQGLEFYKDGVIAYGLGNFAFQMGAPPQSVILDVWLDRNGVRDVQLQPVILDYYGRPSPATKAQAAAIRKKIYDLTTRLAASGNP